MASTDTLVAELNLIKSTQRTRTYLHKSKRRALRLEGADNYKSFNITSTTPSGTRTLGSILSILMIDAEEPIQVSIKTLVSDTPQVITTKFLLLYGALNEVVVSTPSTDPVAVTVYWS